jgi:hypothetical protein
VRQAGVGVLSPQLIPTDEQSGFVDTHRDDGKRLVVHADEKLTAFLELESAIDRLQQDEVLKPCNAAAL